MWDFEEEEEDRWASINSKDEEFFFISRWRINIVVDINCQINTIFDSLKIILTCVILYRVFFFREILKR